MKRCTPRGLKFVRIEPRVSDRIGNVQPLNRKYIDKILPMNTNLKALFCSTLKCQTLFPNNIHYFIYDVEIDVSQIIKPVSVISKRIRQYLPKQRQQCHGPVTSRTSFETSIFICLASILISATLFIYYTWQLRCFQSSVAKKEKRKP